MLNIADLKAAQELADEYEAVGRALLDARTREIAGRLIDGRIQIGTGPSGRTVVEITATDAAAHAAAVSALELKRAAIAERLAGMGVDVAPPAPAVPAPAAAA